jgi:hypothetical protein
LRAVDCGRPARWQLQDGRVLTFAQLRQQDGLSVGKLEGIMMDI